MPEIALDTVSGVRGSFNLRFQEFLGNDEILKMRRLSLCFVLQFEYTEERKITTKQLDFESILKLLHTIKRLGSSDCVVIYVIWSYRLDTSIDWSGYTNQMIS